VTTPTSQASALLGFDFESWRAGVTRWLVATAVLLAAYWLLWFTDRSAVAASRGSQYVAFEQAFPLADAWLLAALVLAGIQLHRHQPSALLWVLVVGGAGLYLCAMDVLYDLQHAIYSRGQGGAIELAINLITAASSVGIMIFGWRFRHALLGAPFGEPGRVTTRPSANAR
jgi:hypothetical protein